MNICERVMYTLNLFHNISWMSKSGTWSEHVETSFRPLRTEQSIFSQFQHYWKQGVKFCQFQYDPETKCQSMEWRTESSERPKRFQKLRIRMILNLC